MTKRDWMIRCIWIFIIILYEYFFHQDSAVINAKYEKRRMSNPLYRSGHLRKRRGKYDRRKYRISEIKGFFVSQMIAISYLTALSVYEIAKFIFKISGGNSRLFISEMQARFIYRKIYYMYII